MCSREQSALHWATLFNSVHPTQRAHTATHSQRHEACKHTVTHTHACSHATDTHHGQANTHTPNHANPEAEDIFCHWCLSTDINHRRVKCLCELHVYRGFFFLSGSWLCPCAVYTVYYHSALCVLFISASQRLEGIKKLLWSYLTRLMIHMIMWIKKNNC